MMDRDADPEMRERIWNDDGFSLDWGNFGVTFIPYSEHEGHVESSTGHRIYFTSSDTEEGRGPVR